MAIINMYRKSGEIWTWVFERRKKTDIQTNKQTYWHAYHNTLHPYLRQVTRHYSYSTKRCGLKITSPAGAAAKYCNEYVCVCLSVREDISGTTCAIFTKFFMHVAYGRGSVLFRQGDEIPREGQCGGFSSPLTMHRTA